MIEQQKEELTSIAKDLQFVVIPNEYDILYYFNFFSFEAYNIKWNKFPEVKQKIIEGFSLNNSLHKPKNQQTVINYIFEFVDPEFAICVYNAHIKVKLQLKSCPLINSTFNLFPFDFDNEIENVVYKIKNIKSNSNFLSVITKLSILFDHPQIFQNKIKVFEIESIFTKKKSLKTPIKTKIINDLLNSNIKISPLFAKFLKYIYGFSKTSYKNMLKSKFKSIQLTEHYKFRLKVYSNLILELHQTNLKHALDVILTYDDIDDLSNFEEELELLSQNIEKSNFKYYLRRLFLLNYTNIKNLQLRDALIKPTNYEKYLINKYFHYNFENN